MALALVSALPSSIARAQTASSSAAAPQGGLHPAPRHDTPSWVAPTGTGTVASAEIPAGRSFRVSTLGDGAVLSLSASFGLLLELVISTGELRPQTPIDPDKLLSIDRTVALSDHIEPNSGLLSTVGVAVMAGWAVTDVALAMAYDREDPWAYGVMYAESAAVTWAVSDLVKIAVRRPRPKLYQDTRAGTVDAATDLSLSFYSLHAALCASIAATATTLAFERGGEVEPYLVLAGGTLVTAFVSIERVRARAHFPTDVIAGAIAGAGLGVLVPFVHRVDRTLSFMAVPLDEGGAVLGVSGRM